MTSIMLNLIICATLLPALVQGHCKGNHQCSHNGTCVPGYRGRGFTCKCPMSGYISYGPLCELTTLGFQAKNHIAPILAMYDLRDKRFQNDQMSITFEFQGRCPEHEPRCYLLMLTTDDNKPLTHLLLLRSNTNPTEYNFDLVSPATKMETITAQFIEDVNANKWLSVAVLFVTNREKNKLMTHFLVTSVSSREYSMDIMRIEAYSGDLNTNFINSNLAVGGFYGCVRSVRINNQLVDLKKVVKFRRNGALNRSEINKCVINFCHSCNSNSINISAKTSISRTKCGRNSRCDGTLDASGVLEATCSCKCEIGKRRGLETRIDRDRCRNDLNHNDDECIFDAPTISTGASKFAVNWTTEYSKCLGLDAKTYSIEFLVMTLEANVESMLLLKDVMKINIIKGFLEFCIHGAQCHSFPPVLVSDAAWHAVSVTFRSKQLTLIIDKEAIFYVAEYANSDQICQCELGLPNSCIRGLRISDLYMPVNSEAKLMLDAGRKPILLYMGDGVRVGSHCEFINAGLTPPTCNPSCSDIEECNGHMYELPRCICKARDINGTCILSQNHSGSDKPSRLSNSKEMSTTIETPDDSEATKVKSLIDLSLYLNNQGDCSKATSISITMLIALLLPLAFLY